jgi:protein SCO1
MIFYFQYEKARLERKRIVEMSKGYGKPKVGGPFTLKDLDGKEFTEKDLLGKYTLVDLIYILPWRLVSGEGADP